MGGKHLGTQLLLVLLSTLRTLECQSGGVGISGALAPAASNSQLWLSNSSLPRMQMKALLWPSVLAA